jgi:hypothetical protein
VGFGKKVGILFYFSFYFYFYLYCCYVFKKLISFFSAFINSPHKKHRAKNKALEEQSASTMASIKSSDHVSFSVAQARLQEFFEKFVPTKRLYCINPECVKETEAAVLHIWEAHSLAYEHTDRQAALNVTTMWVNGKPHWVQSHYCCECFKKHVLVGDNKHASQHYEYYCPGVQAVEVYFHYEPVHSTWYNSITKRDEKLSERQLCMLSSE